MLFPCTVYGACVGDGWPAAPVYTAAIGRAAYFSISIGRITAGADVEQQGDRNN